MQRSEIEIAVCFSPGHAWVAETVRIEGSVIGKRCTTVRRARESGKTTANRYTAVRVVVTGTNGARRFTNGKRCFVLRLGRSGFTGVVVHFDVGAWYPVCVVVRVVFFRLDAAKFAGAVTQYE